MVVVATAAASVSPTVGWISLVGAIIAWGSFTIPIKLKSVQSVKADPLILQLYQSIAIFLTSWLVLTYTKFQFTYFGIIGAGKYFLCVAFI